MKPQFSWRSSDPAVSLPRARSALVSTSRTAVHDPRWPFVTAALAALRDKHRCAVRIVDADCGAGALLFEAVRHARKLGFTAIEGRGIDGSPALVGRARAAASRISDHAIGVDFEMTDMVAALRDEQDFPADVVLWHGSEEEDRHAGVVDALMRAGRAVIGDHGPILVERGAA